MKRFIIRYSFALSFAFFLLIYFAEMMFYEAICRLSRLQAHRLSYLRVWMLYRQHFEELYLCWIKCRDLRSALTFYKKSTLSNHQIKMCDYIKNYNVDCKTFVIAIAIVNTPIIIILQHHQ